MSRLPQVTARKLLAALQREGFVIDRVKGSHYFLRHKDSPDRRTVVALHSGDIPQGPLRDILKQAGLSREAFSRSDAWRPPSAGWRCAAPFLRIT